MRGFFLLLTLAASFFTCNKDDCQKTKLNDIKTVFFKSIVTVQDSDSVPLTNVPVGIVYQWNTCQDGSFEEVSNFDNTSSIGQFEFNWLNDFDRSWTYTDEQDYLRLTFVYGTNTTRFEVAVNLIEYEEVKDIGNDIFVVEHIFTLN